MIDLAGGKTSSTGVKFLTVQNTPGIKPYLIQMYKASLERLAGEAIPAKYDHLFSSAKGAHTKTGFTNLQDAYTYLSDLISMITGQDVFCSSIIVEQKQTIIENNSLTAKKVTTTITVRCPAQQKAFRDSVSRNCNGVCVITGSNVALHAAHLRDSSKGGSYGYDNGLLLDASLHSMFDSGLMAINPETMTAHFASSVNHPFVAMFDGKTLAQTERPINKKNLSEKWELFKTNC